MRNDCDKQQLFNNDENSIPRNATLNEMHSNASQRGKKKSKLNILRQQHKTLFIKVFDTTLKCSEHNKDK